MKQLSVSGCHICLVDDEDFEELSKYKWYLNSENFVNRAVSSPGRRTRILSIHRQIMNAPKGMQVDHINGWRLDNQRGNLRIATRAQNQANTSKKPDNTSGFKGVTWKDGSWAVAFRYKGKLFFKYGFTSRIAAAREYDRMARMHCEGFARLNFPWVESDPIPENYNESRRSRWVEWNGERKSLKDWSRKIGLEVSAIKGRLDSGWPVELALTKPSRSRKRRALNAIESLKGKEQG